MNFLFLFLGCLGVTPDCASGITPGGAGGPYGVRIWVDHVQTKYPTCCTIFPAPELHFKAEDLYYLRTSLITFDYILLIDGLVA